MHAGIARRLRCGPLSKPTLPPNSEKRWFRREFTVPRRAGDALFLPVLHDRQSPTNVDVGQTVAVAAGTFPSTCLQNRTGVQSHRPNEQSNLRCGCAAFQAQTKGRQIRSADTSLREVLTIERAVSWSSPSLGEMYERTRSSVRRTRHCDRPSH